MKIKSILSIFGRDKKVEERKSDTYENKDIRNSKRNIFVNTLFWFNFCIHMSICIKKKHLSFNFRI